MKLLLIISLAALFTGCKDSSTDNSIVRTVCYKDGEVVLDNVSTKSYAPGVSSEDLYKLDTDAVSTDNCVHTNL